MAQYTKEYETGPSSRVVRETSGGTGAPGLGMKTDPELKQWSNFRAAVRGEVGVHQQKREWIWGPY